MIYEHDRKAYYLNEWMRQHQESMMHEMNFQTQWIKLDSQLREKVFPFCGLMCYSQNFLYLSRAFFPCADRRTFILIQDDFLHFWLLNLI